MVGRLGKLVIASAIYGFAIGSVHSRTFAIYNLVKFPLLILITAAVCSVSYYAAIRFVTRRLSFGEVQGLAVGTFQESLIIPCNDEILRLRRQAEELFVTDDTNIHFRHNLREGCAYSL